MAVEKRLGLAERVAVIGIVAGVAGAIAAVALEHAYPAASIWLWRTILWTSLGVLALSLVFLLIDLLIVPQVMAVRRGKRRMIPLIGMIVSGVCFIGFFGWFVWSKTNAPEVPSLPISVSQIDKINFDHKSDFDTDFAKDTPSFWIGEVFISNLSKHQVALEIYLHTTNTDFKPELVIKGDGKDSWGRVKGVNDWGSQLQRKLLADPPNYLRSPLILAPLETVHGVLTFVLPLGPNGDPSNKDNFGFGNIYLHLFQKYIPLSGGTVTHEPPTGYLEIRDQVSGISVTVPIPGSYHGRAD